jgi:N-acetylglucosamine kinase-like BadF-type ATPase
MLLGLGLDGGGSATRWALCEEGGALVARGELPPISGHLVKPDERARLAQVAALLRAALPAGGPPARVVAGITGLSAEAPEAGVASAILAAGLGLPVASVLVSDDTWIAYHAAFRPGEGHVVYAGTGSVGMHVRADGTVVAVGARGMLIDDAGSAFWIGSEALNLIYRRLDEDPAAGGRLAQEIYADVGGATWPAVRTYVYADGRNRVAMLARAVARAAAADDADALAIMRRAGAELARLALALVPREGVRPVALLGRAARLHPAILEGMRQAAPELTLTLRDNDAAMAAARLALAAVASKGSSV